MLIASCEDHASIRQVLTKQTTLINTTAHAVKHAESSHTVIAALRHFNSEMEKLHACLVESQKRSSTLKSLISTPPRALADDVHNLKTAAQTLRETLATAFMYCEDSQLRKMLIKTATTLEKTLAQ